ncbi:MULTISPECIES: hypothetical protein [Bradyrhizobium]|uniref:hypothetical protein n=1 Tax=Bradyrhizobium TaxID=374 RepID=UPI000231D77D|nr:hypothetical protein [Bradyrhizobium japonicum]AJA63271.1 hypothetical protein RN69_25275 [Bradyrhizobium japonicum]MCD9109912.1 hypothetical protein [Bradyrhizobium japonicum]MCD9256682.1 hypothetical protein [Bradyrhizobium japonicum SEMIA 5079]MCD9910374.1 hypothetical protein [Bradyrhizobium japonicum]MCS3540106.1 hypothetical protein [Bradyrhizobium japonicum]
MATHETTTISRLVSTHRDITELARAPMPLDALLDVASGIQREVVGTPSADWAEFGAKACLLINELTTDPTTGWLDAIRESLRADVDRLAAI